MNVWGMWSCCSYSRGCSVSMHTRLLAASLSLSFTVTLTQCVKSSTFCIYRRQVVLKDSKVSLISKLLPSYLYKEQCLWVWALEPIAWAQILILPLTICITLGEWFNFMNLSHLLWKNVMYKWLSLLNRVTGAGETTCMSMYEMCLPSTRLMECLVT